jgi:hypothetical protein
MLLDSWLQVLAVSLGATQEESRPVRTSRVETVSTSQLVFGISITDFVCNCCYIMKRSRWNRGLNLIPNLNGSERRNDKGDVEILLSGHSGMLNFSATEKSTVNKFSDST